MLADQEVSFVRVLPLVHRINCVLCRLSVLKRNVALIRELISCVSNSLNMSRLNFSKLRKHLLESGVVSVSRQALDEEVEEAAVLTLALLTPLMGEHLNLLAVKFEDSGLFDCAVRGILAFELDISESSGLAVWIELKLARTHGAEGRECVVELLLRDCEVNVAHEHVRLWLHEIAFLQIAADVVVSDLRVVQLSSTPLGLLEFEKLKETVAILALSLLVHVDDCLIHIESELLNMLV